MKYAVLFPGQGSQRVGMGEDLFAAHPNLLGAAAEARLGWSLRTVCLEGPEEELTRTDRAQPALYALAYALWQELAAAVAHPPAGAAGHSLGEYTALAAAGVFGYEDGLDLVAARGRAMAEAAAREPSGMAAVIGVSDDDVQASVQKLRAGGGRLWVANSNAPGQVVVAGAQEDIDALAADPGAIGARRAIRLSVAGAFHTPFMEPAVEALRAALSGVEFRPPAFPVWANPTAAPMTDPAAELLSQLVSPVQFAASLVGMAAVGIDTFVHVGPGDVTAGMARRTVPGATVVTVSGREDVEEAAERLSSLS